MQEQDKDLSVLEKRIKVYFSDKELLKTALTHRSWINENRSTKRQHNERLEFLGDAVLELVITEFLFNRFPSEPEGKLTAYRAALVNTIALAEVAKFLGINDFLYLSKGEAKDAGKKSRDHILANTVEAIIGAIYLQHGYKRAKEFIEENIASRTDKMLKEKTYLDPKSAFQEIAQDKKSITPSYEVVKEEGPDHDKIFEVRVLLNKQEIARGKGKNKQEAERDAAKNALHTTGWIDEL